MISDIIKIDYYNERFSYMKLIMDNLNKSDIAKKVISDIYNGLLSRLDSKEINEIVIYSALFESKINKMQESNRLDLLNNLYDSFINGMMLNFYNKDIDAVNMLFKRLEENIKMYSGYYGLYGDEGYFNSIENKKSLGL